MLTTTPQLSPAGVTLFTLYTVVGDVSRGPPCSSWCFVNWDVMPGLSELFLQLRRLVSHTLTVSGMCSFPPLVPHINKFLRPRCVPRWGLSQVPAAVFHVIFTSIASALRVSDQVPQFSHFIFALMASGMCPAMAMESMQQTTTPQGSPAGATLSPHSAFSWVTFPEVSTTMFQVSCLDFPSCFCRHVPSCSSPRHFVSHISGGSGMCLTFLPRFLPSTTFHFGLASMFRDETAAFSYSHLDTLAFNPCSSNGPSS